MNDDSVASGMDMSESGRDVEDFGASIDYSDLLLGGGGGGGGGGDDNHDDDDEPNLLPPVKPHNKSNKNPKQDAIDWSKPHTRTVDSKNPPKKYGAFKTKRRLTRSASASNMDVSLHSIGEGGDDDSEEEEEKKKKTSDRRVGLAGTRCSLSMNNVFQKAKEKSERQGLGEKGISFTLRRHGVPRAKTMDDVSSAARFRESVSKKGDADDAHENIDLADKRKGRPKMKHLQMSRSMSMSNLGLNLDAAIAIPSMPVGRIPSSTSADVDGSSKDNKDGARACLPGYGKRDSKFGFYNGRDLSAKHTFEEGKMCKSSSRPRRSQSPVRSRDPLSKAVSMRNFPSISLVNGDNQKWSKQYTEHVDPKDLGYGETTVDADALGYGDAQRDESGRSLNDKKSKHSHRSGHKHQRRAASMALGGDQDSSTEEDNDTGLAGTSYHCRRQPSRRQLVTRSTSMSHVTNMSRRNLMSDSNHTKGNMVDASMFVTGSRIRRLDETSKLFHR